METARSAAVYEDPAELAALRDRETYLKNRRVEDAFRHGALNREQATLLAMEKDLYACEESLQRDIEKADDRGRDVTARSEELAQLKQRNQARIAEMREAFHVFQTEQTPSPPLLQGQSSPKDLLSGIHVLEQSVAIENGPTVTELSPSNPDCPACQITREGLAAG